MEITQEHKDAFLANIRAGDDRATAAWRVHPDLSGSRFKSMCNPRSTKHYDPVFAQAYAEACEARGPLARDRQRVRSEDRPPPAKRFNGVTKSIHLSNDELTEFLQHVVNGEQAYDAARKIGTTMSQISRRAAQDGEFARAFEMAKAEGYDTYKLRLEAKAAELALKKGDYRALRDQLIRHVDGYREALTTSRHEIGGIDGGAIRVLAEQHFPGLPAHVLDELIRNVEEREGLRAPDRRALPAA
jgi:hypothetical protein